MARGALIWGGAAVAVAAAAGLGVYFVRVGLEEADKLASVIGVFLAVAGLGVAVYGLIANRPSSGGRQDAPRVSASGERSIAIGGDNSGIASTGDGATSVQMKAEASGQGRVYQAGRDQIINDR